MEAKFLLVWDETTVPHEIKTHCKVVIEIHNEMIKNNTLEDFLPKIIEKFSESVKIFKDCCDYFSSYSSRNTKENDTHVLFNFIVSLQKARLKILGVSGEIKKITFDITEFPLEALIPRDSDGRDSWKCYRKIYY